MAHAQGVWAFAYTRVPRRLVYILISLLLTFYPVPIALDCLRTIKTVLVLPACKSLELSWITMIGYVGT